MVELLTTLNVELIEVARVQVTKYESSKNLATASFCTLLTRNFCIIFFFFFFFT